MATAAVCAGGQAPALLAVALCCASHRRRRWRGRPCYRYHLHSVMGEGLFGWLLGVAQVDGGGEHPLSLRDICCSSWYRTLNANGCDMCDATGPSHAAATAAAADSVSVYGQLLVRGIAKALKASPVEFSEAISDVSVRAPGC